VAKQSTGQKKTMERVMHEFKHGELKTAGGRKVKNQRQAVAIGMHESGSSNQESPKENRENLKKTKAKERQGQTGRDTESKADLYAEAKKKDIAGRSKMTKEELKRALH
jgi:Family of unknown function (DUF6496)